MQIFFVLQLIYKFIKGYLIFALTGVTVVFYVREQMVFWNILLAVLQGYSVAKIKKIFFL